MKLYHYVSKGNNVLTKGLLSFAKNPDADIAYYTKRSKASSHQGIVDWMERCLSGRSRGIRFFSEPIKWTPDSLSLKEFINNADMFSVDLDALSKDGLIEAVYLSPAVAIDPLTPPQTGKGISGVDEQLIKLKNISEISFCPIDWSVCNDKMGRRFAFVPYYLLIIKGGIIPPQYLTLEK